MKKRIVLLIAAIGAFFSVKPFTKVELNTVVKKNQELKELRNEFIKNMAQALRVDSQFTEDDLIYMLDMISFLQVREINMLQPGKTSSITQLAEQKRETWAGKDEHEIVKSLSDSNEFLIKKQDEILSFLVKNTPLFAKNNLWQQQFDSYKKQQDFLYEKYRILNDLAKNNSHDWKNTAQHFISDLSCRVDAHDKRRKGTIA